MLHLPLRTKGGLELMFPLKSMPARDKGGKEAEGQDHRGGRGDQTGCSDCVVTSHQGVGMDGAKGEGRWRRGRPVSVVG